MPILSPALSAHLSWQVWTVKQSGGDFSTLAAACSDASVTMGDTIRIEGSWSVDDTAAVTVVDGDLNIAAVGESRVDPSSLSSPTHYRLRVVRGAGGSCITALMSYNFWLDGIEIRVKASGASVACHCIRMDSYPISNDTVTIKNCVLYPLIQYSGYTYGVYWLPIGTLSGLTVNLDNCIIFNTEYAGIYVITSETLVQTITVNMNSCSIYGCNTKNSTIMGGISLRRRGPGTLNFNYFNSVVVGNNNADYFIYAGVGNIDYCIDSDGSIDSADTGAVGCLTNRTPVDYPPGTGDWVVFQNCTSLPYNLRLRPDVENDAQQMHSSSTGAGLSMLAYDIQGDIREAPYDCGADVSLQVAGIKETYIRTHLKLLNDTSTTKLDTWLHQPGAKTTKLKAWVEPAPKVTSLTAKLVTAINDTVRPYSIITQTNMTGSVSDLTNDPDSGTDGNWVVANSDTVDTVLEVNFPDLPGPLNTGAGLQEIRARVAESQISNSPDNVSMYIYEGGTLRATLYNQNNPLYGTGGAVISGTWDASILSTQAADADVRVRITCTADTSPPPQVSSLDVDSIEWNFSGMSYEATYFKSTDLTAYLEQEALVAVTDLDGYLNDREIHWNWLDTVTYAYRSIGFHYSTTRTIPANTKWLLFLVDMSNANMLSGSNSLEVSFDVYLDSVWERMATTTWTGGSFSTKYSSTGYLPVLVHSVPTEWIGEDVRGVFYFNNAFIAGFKMYYSTDVG